MRRWFRRSRGCRRERIALIQCARALGLSYAGTRRPPEDEWEQCALWDAMHAAYNALGVMDTRELQQQ